MAARSDRNRVSTEGGVMAEDKEWADPEGPRRCPSMPLPWSYIHQHLLLGKNQEHYLIAAAMS